MYQIPYMHVMDMLRAWHTFNSQLTIHKSELMRWRKRNPFGIKKSVKFLYAIKRKRWWYQLYYCFCQRDGRNLNKKSLVVLAMAPRKQKTVESGGIGLMSDGREAHSVPFPIWRKFINRLALAALAHCNDNVNDDGNLRIGHSEKILLRFLVATLCGDDTLTLIKKPVLPRKYSST